MKYWRGEGGIWPTIGTDAVDIGLAIYDARYPPPEEDRQFTRSANLERRTMRPRHDAPESDTIYWSAFHPDIRIDWEVRGENPVWDELVERRIPVRTLKQSQDAAQSQAQSRGRHRVATWDAQDFFPYQLEVSPKSTRSPNLEEVDIQEEFLWIARRVFIPQGWATYMAFSTDEEVVMWGAVPGHDEPIRLPDDFLHTENDAWSLFDREPTT